MNIGLSKLAQAIERFAEVFGDGYLLTDLGPTLTCEECETLAILLETLGETGSATILRESHCLGDEEDDMPSHLELKRKIESNP